MLPKFFNPKFPEHECMAYFMSKKANFGLNNGVSRPKLNKPFALVIHLPEPKSKKKKDAVKIFDL